MENATRALTMAGSVLIALVIIGAILLVFNNLNSYQKVSDQLKKDEKVLEFNNQFETYNRTDVRGSDILSLVNRVIDYNERQSYVGKEGQDLGYKPIILTINLDKAKENIKHPNPNNPDAEEIIMLFKDDFIISETFNSEGNKKIKRILEDIKNIQNEYTQTELSELAASEGSIFIGKKTADNEKEIAEAVKKYNNIVKNQISDYSEIAPGTGRRIKVYKYYEYIQFKRSYFDCISDESGKNSGVEYDDNGRITKMTFYANGNVE